MRHQLLVICLAVSVSQALAAQSPASQTPSATASSPAKMQVVHAGKLIDVRTGHVTPNAYIIIRGERIDSIATQAPADAASVIDMSRYTIVPGLIDAHGHILSDPTTQSSAAIPAHIGAPGDRPRRLEPAALAQARIHCRSRCLRILSFLSAVRPARRRSQRSDHRSPIVAAGSCVSLTGGHGDADRLSPDKPSLNEPNQVDTVDDVSRIVRRDIKYGADWIKLMATGGVMDPISDYRVQELSDAQMARAVEDAHRAGHKVMAHAEGTIGIKAAVRAGVDSIEHGTMLDEEGAKMMAERGTWLVPTLYCFQHDLQTGLSKGREPSSMAKGIAIVKEQGPAFQRALKYHLKIAYGVDDDDVDESVSKEFGAFVRGGMTPLQALQAATINGAQLLSLDQELGAIEAGKFADLVAVPSNPLDDITVMEHVAWVMKAGTVVHPLNN